MLKCETIIQVLFFSDVQFVLDDYLVLWVCVPQQLLVTSAWVYMRVART
jgi:hypothetical protein